MKAINQKATATLTKLLASVLDAPLGECGKVGEDGAGFMPVHTARLGARVYSVGHFYEQNGDRMADPEIEFWRGDDGAFYPVTYRQDGLGIFRQMVEFGDDGRPARISPRAQADTAAFCGMWLRNIAAQQAEALRAIKPRAA